MGGAAATRRVAGGMDGRRVESIIYGAACGFRGAAMKACRSPLRRAAEAAISRAALAEKAGVEISMHGRRIVAVGPAPRNGPRLCYFLVTKG